VAQPKAKLISPAGRLVFTWKPAEAKTPGGIYLFRYGATTARINHQKNAPSVSGNLPTSNLKPETRNSKHDNNPKRETRNTEQNYSFHFTPGTSCNILFDETTRDYELAEGENSLSAALTPTAYMHSYTVEGNVSDANVSISADGSEVFSGTGSFDTDSTYMDSREKELNLHAEATGYKALDTVVTGNWQGATIKYTMQEETTPTDSYEHVIAGEAMDGGYITIWDSQADTMLTDTEEANGIYHTSFTNTNESQDVRITQSAPDVNQKSWNATVTDTLRQDLTNVVGQYEFTGSAGPDGAWVKIYNPQTQEGIDSAQVQNNEYTVTFDHERLDSVRMKEEKEDHQSLDTLVTDMEVGTNTVNLASLDPDTLSYTIQGSAATDSTSYIIVDNANTEDTIATGVAYNENNPDYEETFKRAATNKIDRIDYTLSRDGYADTTITRNINSEGGNTQVDLPSLTELPEYVLNDEVYGQILREAYPYEGDYNYIGNAKIVVEGLNVDHKDSTNMNNNTKYYFYNLKVPTDAQGEADTAQYVRTITPTKETSNQMFKAKKDTFELTESSNGLDMTYVKELEQNVTLTGTIRDIYDETKTLDSTNVQVYNKSDSTLVGEAVTDADGKYRVPNVECNTEIFFKVGYHDHQASGYLSDVGHTYTTKEEVIKPGEDSTATINYMLVPTELPIPAPDGAQNDGNTVTADPREIDEVIRSPPGTYVTEAERARDRKVTYNIGSFTSNQQDWILENVVREKDSLFHGISTTVPINDPARPDEIVYDNIPVNDIKNYHPITNPNTDSTGWNVSEGGNTTTSRTTPVENGKQYDESAVVGGSMEIDLVDQAGNIKEWVHRANVFNDITSWTSVGNPDAAYPTLKDRAYFNLVWESNEARWNKDSEGAWYSTYPLDKLEYSISK